MKIMLLNKRSVHRRIFSITADLRTRDPASTVRNFDYGIEIILDSDPSETKHSPYFVIDSSNTVAAVTAASGTFPPSASASAAAGASIGGGSSSTSGTTMSAKVSRIAESSTTGLRSASMVMSSVIGRAKNGSAAEKTTVTAAAAWKMDAPASALKSDAEVLASSKIQGGMVATLLAAVAAR